MKVIPLRRGDKKQAALVVARAFYEYPSIKAYFPDSKRREHKLRCYMSHVLESAMRYGEVLSTDDLSGVLFLLPPGHTRLTDWDYVKVGFIVAPLITGLRQHAFVNTCETFLADTQEQLLQGHPHYYLWGLAVDSEKQRRGSGTALLEALFKKVDREGLPVYLETHQFENVAYYEQHGFDLIHVDRMPGEGMQFWCMLRGKNMDSKKALNPFDDKDTHGPS